jgi:hypothetical protein
MCTAVAVEAAVAAVAVEVVAAAVVGVEVVATEINDCFKTYRLSTIKVILM